MSSNTQKQNNIYPIRNNGWVLFFGRKCHTFLINMINKSSCQNDILFSKIMWLELVKFLGIRIFELVPIQPKSITSMINGEHKKVSTSIQTSMTDHSEKEYCKWKYRTLGSRHFLGRANL